MQDDRKHLDKSQRRPTLDIETQISLSEALLDLADRSIERGAADSLAILDRIAVSLIPYMSDAEVSFITLSEYLDSARSCVLEGIVPYSEPSTIQERQVFEEDLKAARKKVAHDRSDASNQDAPDADRESDA